MALDRFSGGQTHGLLFNQEVVEEGTVNIDITVADPTLREEADALIKAVALDIHDGYVGVGHGTARGMGSLQLTDDDAKAFRTLWLETLEKVTAAAEEGEPS